MQMARPVLVLLLLLALTLPASAKERGEDELRRDMEFAREQVYPALVNIGVVAKVHRDGRSQRFPAAGSGVIVSPAGHVVTNYHVAGEATRIVCRLPSEEVIEADVVAHDPLTDLSVLKLKLDSRVDRNAPIPFARIGNSDVLTTGDYVLAMGNPLTLSSSMTLGIVSNPKRVFASFTGAEMDELDLGGGQMTGLFTRWIQHDALILPGNSGGPLVNLKGEVVGINELGGGGVGFAIPSNLMSWVLNQALAYGEVRRGWLGIEVAHTEKLGGAPGALVSFVQPGSPAAKAGLQAGDFLVSIDGAPVESRLLEQIPVLYDRIARLEPGATTQFRIVRPQPEAPKDFENVTSLEATVGLMEKFLADEQEDKVLGLTIRDITGPMALLRRYPDDQGVLITGIRPGFAAEDARPRLRAGDVLREVNGKPVVDAAAYSAILADLGTTTKVAVRVRRKVEDVVTVVDVEKKKKPKGGGELAKPWLGIRTQVLTPDVAVALGLEKVRGFRVTQVFPDTAAAKAGLQVGDVITSLAGKALKAYRPQDAEILRRRIERMTIGENAEFVVLRGGAETTVSVVLEETPQTATEVKGAKDELLEFKVRNIVFGDRIEKQWPADQQGVVVVEVTRGGWANLAGLRAGDLLLTMDGHETTDVATFKEVVKSVGEAKPTPIVLFVRRSWRTKFLFVEPEYPETEESE